MSAPVQGSLSDSAYRVFTDFTQAWRPGVPPVLRDYFSRCAPPDQGELVRALVYHDLWKRERTSQGLLSEEEYHQQVPGHAAQVSKAFSEFHFDKLGTTIAQDQEASAVDVLSDQTTLAESSRVILELGNELGRGGMGVVHKGRDIRLERDVAIKVLRSDRDSQQTRGRFEREAKILARLQHPGIVPIHDIGERDGQPYFTMKLVEGSTLSDLLKLRAELNADRGKWIAVFQDVCRALAYAHSREVIHRDLKPQNVMIGGFGEVLVMDWGLAKDLASESSSEAADAVSGIETAQDSVATAPGVRGGTLAYMAPEISRDGLDRADKRSDVFGLGTILCEILTGQAPYDAVNHIELHHPDLNDAFARLDNCGTDAELILLAKRCLSVDPEDRPRDAGVLAGEVTTYLESVEARLRQAELDRTAAEVKVVEERKRRKLTLGLAVAIVVVIALLAGAALWFQSQFADTKGNVESALAKVEQSRDQFRQMPTANAQETAAAIVVLRQAQAAIEEAESVLETGVASDDLRIRVATIQSEVDQDLSQLEKEAKLFRALDRARMSSLALRRSRGNGLGPRHKWTDADGVDRPVRLLRFDYERSAEEYADAFAEYGLQVESGDLAQLASRMRNQRTDVREAMIQSLDNWSIAADFATRSEPIESITPLATRDLAQLAQDIDPDAQRQVIRGAAWLQDVARLKDIVADAARRDLSLPLIDKIADVLLRAGDRELGLSLLRHERAKNPSDFWIQFNLATTLESEGRTDSDLRESIGCYWSAIALRPDAAAAHYNLGLALSEGGDERNALAAYYKSIAIDARDSDAFYNVGNSLFRLSDFSGAAAAYRQALEIDPALVSAHINLGNTLIRLHDLTGAAVAFQNAADSDSKDVTALFNLGNTLEDLGDYHASLAAYNSALAVEPNDADVLTNMGNVYVRLGDVPKALAAYASAITSDTKHVKARHNLACVFLQQGDFEAAASEIKQLLEIDSAYPDSHHNLGFALWNLSDIQGSIAAYRRAVQLDPTAAHSFACLGYMLVLNHETDAAVKACRKATDIDPGLAMAHNNLGLALISKGDFIGAEAACRKAIEIDPHHVEAHENLDFALLGQGDYSGAVTCLERLLALLPKNHPKRITVLQRLTNRKFLVAQASRLAEFIAGRMSLAENAERLAFAEVCYYQRRYVTAVHLYVASFEADQSVADEVENGDRYNAACCAALAGNGQGVKARELTAEEQSALRKQAVEWLRADLAARTKRLESGEDEDRRIVVETLRHWQRDADLAGIRDEEQLAKLPAEEQQACRELWAEVDSLLVRASAEPEPLEAP